MGKRVDLIKASPRRSRVLGRSIVAATNLLKQRQLVRPLVFWGLVLHVAGCIPVSAGVVRIVDA